MIFTVWPGTAMSAAFWAVQNGSASVPGLLSEQVDWYPPST
ncbi:hypothetical protein [Kutzneria sp. NPDC052558]